ncbi:MAG: CNP1-like family protein [Rhodocyclales bacterium]|nr:CNP1-like family protein [Rhodocyclales bacterium]
MKRLFLLAMLVAGPASAAEVARDIGFHEPVRSNFSEQPWAEERVAPPAPPKDADLVAIHVGTNTANRFFVDAATLSVGGDGIVRYVLVVRTAGGASNTTFEGIRCETGEYKLYASGRADGTWAPSRLDTWRPIENKLANRHHAALNRDLFCPAGARIQSAAEGRDALRLGKHPRAP